MRIAILSVAVVLAGTAGTAVPIGGSERQRVRMQLYQALRRLAKLGGTIRAADRK